MIAYKNVITRFTQLQYRNLFENEHFHTVLILFNDNSEDQQCLIVSNSYN